MVLFNDQDPVVVFRGLLNAAGIMGRAVKLTPGWLKDAAGAMLALDKDGVVMPLIPSVHGYVTLDLQTGKKMKVTPEIAATLQADAWCFYRPLPPHQLTKRDVFRFIRTSLDASDYVGAALCTLLAAAVGVVAPYANEIIFGTALPQGNALLFLGIVVFLLSATISQAIFSAINSVAQTRIAAHASQVMDAAVMMRLLYLPAAFHRKHPSGELASRIAAASRIPARTIVIALGSVMGAAASLIFYLRIALFTPSLLLPTTLSVLASVGLGVLITNTVGAEGRKANALRT